MTECIRRAHSVWTTCLCDPCTLDRRRKHKLAAAGRYHRIPSDTAWEEIDRLLARNWTPLAIASSAGLDANTLQNSVGNYQRTGKKVRFGPRTARLIVNHGEPTHGQIGATGSCRRLQGLARQGWDLYTLADKSGIGYSTLAAIRVGSTTRVSAARHTQIRELTDSIGMTIGPSNPSRIHATKAGWASLLAWDDNTIDDPAATPHGTHAGHTTDLRTTRAADLEHIAYMGGGVEDACRQLGIATDTLWKWCQRHGHLDLYERLARRHRQTENQHTTKGVA